MLHEVPATNVPLISDYEVLPHDVLEADGVYVEPDSDQI